MVLVVMVVVLVVLLVVLVALVVVLGYSELISKSSPKKGPKGFYVQDIFGVGFSQFFPPALRFGDFRLQIRILRVEISQETDSEVWTPDSGPNGICCMFTP